jgi:hypothetical protein
MVPYFKTQLVGMIFSGIAYGIVLVLSGNCICLHQRKRGNYSNRMRILLIIYVTVMLLCSTWTLMQSVCLFMEVFISRDILANYLLYLPLGFPLAMWGADGFMARIPIFLQEQDLQSNYRYGVVSCCTTMFPEVPGL